MTLQGPARSLFVLPHIFDGKRFANDTPKGSGRIPMVEPMISGALLWSALPRMWKLGIGVFVLIALLGAFLVIRHQIYQEGFKAAQEACEREKEAQRQANEAAIRRAEKDLFEAADKLSIQKLELADALKALDAASAADPLGSRECLSADSVRRLQTLTDGANPAP